MPALVDFSKHQLAELMVEQVRKEAALAKQWKVLTKRWRDRANELSRQGQYSQAGGQFISYQDDDCRAVEIRVLLTAAKELEDLCQESSV